MIEPLIPLSDVQAALEAVFRRAAFNNAVTSESFRAMYMHANLCAQVHPDPFMAQLFRRISTVARDMYGASLHRCGGRE